MKQNDSLTDPRRTIAGAKTVDGLVHRVFKGKIPVDPRPASAALPPEAAFYSGCGIAISKGDLLVILCRPEDITCPNCADSRISKEEIDQVLKSHPKIMAILPPSPGCCQVCGTEHEPAEPHNQKSLYYQMKFHHDYGRWPTWEDAMRHCSEETKALWREQLKFFNEKLD